MSFRQPVVAIGSFAYRHLVPKYRGTPADLDLVIYPGTDAELTRLYGIPTPIFIDGRLAKLVFRGPIKIEAEIAYPGSSGDLLLRIAGPPVRLLNIQVSIPSLESMMAIYKSHLVFPIHVQKHLPRYEALTDTGVKPDDEICAKRLSETSVRLKYDASRYDQPNESFFKDRVLRSVPHDQLHLRFKFGDHPAYESIKRDLSRSGICIDMFDALSHESKLRCIWEEVLVLGWERVLSRKNIDKSAVADQFVIGMFTNYLPLEFRGWVLDNRREIMSRFPYEKWETLWRI